MGRKAVIAVLGLVLGACAQAASPPASTTADVPPLRSNEFYYRDVTFFVGDGTKSGPFRMETWNAKDGAGRLIYDPPEVGASYYGMPIEKGGFGQTDPADVVYGSHENPFTLIDLSSDTTIARKQLAERSAAGGASPGPQPIGGPVSGLSADELKLMRVMQDLLTSDAEMVATPEAQQGLFEVMRTTPGVSELTGIVDPVGRPAIALVYELPKQMPVFYFDPGTHLLLASADFFGNEETPFDVRVVQAQSLSDTTGVPAGEASLIPTATTAESVDGVRTLKPPVSSAASP